MEGMGGMMWAAGLLSLLLMIVLVLAAAALINTCDPTGRNDAQKPAAACWDRCSSGRGSLSGLASDEPTKA